MKRITAIFVLLVAILAIAVPAFGAGQDSESRGNSDKNGRSVYIVRMSNAPVVAYDGDVSGFPATRPAKGEKINPFNAKVTKYVDFLTKKQDAAVKAVGGEKLYSYVYAFNGFAAEMTAAQVEKLAKLPGVLAVEKDEARQLDTSSTPTFLGLTDDGSLWHQLGWPADANKKVAGAGENVIIGIVDGGIWPEHPSVSDRDEFGKLVYQQIPGWHGRCVPGEQFTAANCNQKLIGARYYNSGWGGNAGIDAQLPWEYNSPRDFGGHGTHTATTAGGNYGVPVPGAASVFGEISGMAPRARIAAYKVCWETGTGGSCYSSDSVAAIDQAVADGVDVINFSISGTQTNFRDSVEIAFMYAADAGVFVAASAGNTGPTTSTVAHPGPWLTTVAAGTHNRSGEATLTLGNGATYTGASFATAIGPLPLVDAANVPAAGISAADAELCGLGTLDPAMVSGKIVLCKRGAHALVDKSLEVYEAGGAGMVLYNDPAGATDTLALFHSVPSVHVVATDGLAVKAYIAAEGAAATAAIGEATILYDVAAPFTASFSSRGPLRAGGGDLLKPDLIAPGQDILAGVAPPGNLGRLFDLYSGTSMSSPHVAGLAALMKDKYPTWSPMMIKSALMTTGSDVLDGPNTHPLVIFRQGAGHVQPNLAADPGLVFDSGWNDWLTFICNTQPAGLEATCNTLWSMGYPTDPSDLNTASIAIGDLPGSQTVRRVVKNVGSSAETYTFAHTGLAGLTVSASPASFTIPMGGTQVIDITINNVSAPLNAYVGGQFTWTGDQGHVIRIPAVVRPVLLGVPATVSGTGDPISYNVGFGYTGPFSAAARGLVAAMLTPGTVDQDPDQTFDPADPTGTVAIPVTIPAGTTYARFALFDEDVTPGTDLDLFVYQGTVLVGQSAAGGSTEEVNFTFTSPTGGPIALTVYVHGWGVVGGTTPFVLHEWYIPAAAAGNMTVSAPASATLGTTGVINLTFSGLAPGTRYLGSVAYSGAAGMPNPTIVRVTTP